jgi:hypothetical protein
MLELVKHKLSTTRRKLKTQHAEALARQADMLEQILMNWEKLS